MTPRILVVDDEPDVEDLFRQNFRREIRKGVYRFEFVLSGESALEALEEETPTRVKLVLSDINMPGMSGIDLLAEVRKTWPDLSVFMITAYGDSGTETKARALGAERFLAKPVDFDCLKEQLTEALETRL